MMAFAFLFIVIGGLALIYLSRRSSLSSQLRSGNVDNMTWVPDSSSPSISDGGGTEACDTGGADAGCDAGGGDGGNGGD